MVANFCTFPRSSKASNALNIWIQRSISLVKICRNGARDCFQPHGVWNSCAVCQNVSADGQTAHYHYYLMFSVKWFTKWLIERFHVV